MKKEILVFIENGYADWEIGYICPLLNQTDSDYIVSMVSFNGKMVTSMGGLQVTPAYSITHLPKEFEMLILAGGTIWLESKYKIPVVNELVDYCISNTIKVAAICDATTFLSENGYLNNIPHTGNSLGYIKMSAPNYKGDEYFIEKQCVSSGQVITANGTAAVDFSAEIMRILHVTPTFPADIDQWYTVNKNGYYPD